jgi:hypothetical protein
MKIEGCEMLKPTAESAGSMKYAHFPPILSSFFQGFEVIALDEHVALTPCPLLAERFAVTLSGQYG